MSEEFGRRPGAAADGRPLFWIDALFTATLALCVTGLTDVDTGTYFSFFGHGGDEMWVEAGTVVGG